MVGWRGVHSRAHLYRAILEGIAFEQRLHTEGVEAALGQPVETYVAMGGGAQSERWLQIIADVTGKPVYRAAVTDAAALGAGILAAAGVGLFPDARAAAAASARSPPAAPAIGRAAGRWEARPGRVAAPPGAARPGATAGGPTRSRVNR